MRKIIWGIITCCLSLASCKKDSTTPDNNNGNNNNNSGGFTPPAEAYWRINGKAHSGSADAVSVNIKANNMSLSKPFTASGYGYCQLRVYFNQDPDIRSQVPEGGHKAYFVTVNSSSPDSIRIEIDVEDQNSGSQGYYYYHATSGKVYISKKNGKLQYTTDGKLPLSGVKYPDMQSYIHSAESEFSIKEKE